MSQILRYQPFAPDVVRALESLEQADTFDAQAFAVVNQERWRRIPIMLGIMIPAAAAGALLVWAADWAGGLGVLAPLLYVVVTPLAAGVALNLLRGDSLKDEQRLGRAIGRWEGRGGVIRNKPLEPSK